MERMGTLRAAATAFAGWLAGSVAAQPVPAAASPPVRQGSVLHVRITGDLECLGASKQLQTILREAQRERAALIVLELSGNQSRMDVVWDMAKMIRSTPVPLSVYLDDADHQVGAGALALGMIAGECILAPGVKITGRVSGSALLGLAPDDTRWASISEELVKWAIDGLGRARALTPNPALPPAEGLPGAVVMAERCSWVLPVRATAAPAGSATTSDWRLVFDEPPAGEGLPIVAADAGSFGLSMEARTAVRLHLATGTLEGWTAIAQRHGLRTAPRIERTISASLSPHLIRAEGLLSETDKVIDRATALLKVPWPAAKDISTDRYHDAAHDARLETARALSRLTEVESLLTECPELLRRPAPGQTAIAAKPSNCATHWRSAVQSRRDKVTKLNEKADRFAALVR